MKKLIRPFTAICAALTLLSSCKKDAKELATEEVPMDVLSQIEGLGFSTDGVQKTMGGYLVEGDILLSPNDLTARPLSANMIIANEEQYRTFNTVNVTNHPVIKIALNNSSAQHQDVFSAALDEAIGRFNAENLDITFQRVTTAPDITVVAYYQVSSTLGSAGFPTATGDPYHEVKMNTYHYNTGVTTTNTNYIATIMSHEFGHCIGYRHTDYANRAYSCGGRRSNEGQANTGVGAVHIPGTPTGGDPSSWMLACVGNGVNRPFNANDKIALSYVY